jgi:hypothetical protein
MRTLFSLSSAVAVIAAITAQSSYAAPAKGAATARAETPSKPSVSSADNACTPAEKWRYGTTVYPEWREIFNSSLARAQAPVWGFSQALGLRRVAQNDENRVLAEYFISRSLSESRLAHVAFNGFNIIASRTPTPETFGVQMAAVDCLNQIQKRFPTFEPSARVSANMSALLKMTLTERQKQVAYTYLGDHALSMMAAGRSKSEIQEMIALLKGSGPIEWFVKGMLAARGAEHASVITQMEKFLKAPALPTSVARYADQAHLVAARSYFSTERFDLATVHLKAIKKSSNELAKSLSELSWAYLQDERYSEAIGTAMNLQQGGLRSTFAPEAPMVMSMALNEICQYPESLKAINGFRRGYEQAYRYLSAWNSSPERPAIYPIAVQFLKRQAKIPVRVGSEWVRSPLFISHQDEINLLFDEKDNTAKLSKSGASEQRKLGAQVRGMSKELKAKIRLARSMMKPGDDLPASVRNDLSRLRKVLTHYGRFRRAAPTWRVILTNFQKMTGPQEKKLVDRINTDLASRSVKMLHQLEEIAENNQLIEVEIYNGASQDIIWQNAHPDYKELAKNMKDEQHKSAQKVYDWGVVANATDEGGEIWEDELGSFKADLYDNCSSKDKYLALKRSTFARSPASN